MMSRSTTRSTIDICADCGALDPSWASINRGVLVCDGCCSVHLSLGRHVSQIKSIKKGSWHPQQLSMVYQLVNSGANNIWEYSLLDPGQNKQGRKKPTPRDPVHQVKSDFIRAKYQFLSFVNKHKDSGDQNAPDDISKQLHSSVRTNNLETSLRLLSNGADANFIHPDKGNTPLHIACMTGQATQAELLLVYGADPTALDHCCKTPADVARNEGHTDLADRMVECQYELTDGLAFYLCNRRPDHRGGQHFLIPEMADRIFCTVKAEDHQIEMWIKSNKLDDYVSLDLSELAKGAKKKLQALSNHLFEELAMDVYDELDRRENEAIWLSSQPQNSVVLSDRHIVPFLPANPEFSATRNQGRQKLAKFNKREFATLIIDILNDAKRRYLKAFSPSTLTGVNVDTGKLPRLTKDARRSASMSAAGGSSNGGERREGVGGGGGLIKRSSSLSDDEPLYDSVCSGDEDYASIGDNQSTASNQPAELITTAGVVHKFSTTGSGDTLKDGAVSDQGESSPQDVSGRMLTVSVKDYEELKLQLNDSQAKIEQLLQSNASLKEDVSVLQNMVKKLVQENRLLRCGYTPAELPASVNGGLDEVSTSGDSRGPSSSDLLSKAGSSSFMDSAGGQARMPRWSMIEQGEAKRQLQCQAPPFASLKEEAPFVAQGASQDMLSSPAFEPLSNKPTQHSKSVPGSGARLDNVEATKSNGPLSVSDNVLTTSSAGATASAATVETLVPSQDVVVKKTEKITRTLQELFQSAQEGKHDRYVPCSDKIHSAVEEMMSLFSPLTLSADNSALSERMRRVLQQLSASAEKLRKQCEEPAAGVRRDHRQHTQIVIQSAFDIAKAAKQLVLLFE